MYDELYASLFEIVSFFNRPHQDAVLISEAGVSLDVTFFPLLMIIGHREAIGIVELASMVNKDYSTVSRQVDTLRQLGMVETVPAPKDHRIRQITTTAVGREAIQKIVHTRRTMMAAALSGWSEEEIHWLRATLAHLVESLPGQES